MRKVKERQKLSKLNLDNFEILTESEIPP